MQDSGPTITDNNKKDNRLVDANHVAPAPYCGSTKDPCEQRTSWGARCTLAQGRCAYQTTPGVSR